MKELIEKINATNDFDALNDIIENAANDDTLTNDEYTAIYEHALNKARA